MYIPEGFTKQEFIDYIQCTKRIKLGDRVEFYIVPVVHIRDAYIPSKIVTSHVSMAKVIGQGSHDGCELILGMKSRYCGFWDIGQLDSYNKTNDADQYTHGWSFFKTHFSDIRIARIFHG